MKSVSAGLLAHIASESSTLATCWRITRQDAQVFTFTDHDADIVYGGLTYAAATGYAHSDVSDTDGLAVDNLEVSGVLTSPSITEDDLGAGLWDYAEVEIFEVNYSDLTQGALILRTGTLGEVTTERGQFRAEIRGLTQALQKTVGQVDSAGCRARFGDTRCGVSLGGYTVTGTIDSVHDDGVTLYDSARTEAGPEAGIAITNIQSLGNDGEVYVSAATADYLTHGEFVAITGVVGIEEVNRAHVVRYPDTAGFTIEHHRDPWYGTGDVGYVSGGTVTRFRNSGYFDGGLITFTSGACVGLSMEVKAYVPGQITLHLPLPYAVAAGDGYSLIAGCDKSLATCRDRFANVVNFRGEPYLPGIDKVLQPGR